MKRTIRNGILGAALAAMAGTAYAQSSGIQSRTGGSYSMVPDAPAETPEQSAANAGESVIIHFTGDVTYVSTLQLVVMVQEYYRRGYRRFVMPIQTRGGDVNSAMFAYETLSRMPIEFSTAAIGPVDSAGIFLYCLGDKRYAMPGASFLFHPMSGTVDTNRRGQEAAERQVESLNAWISSAERACFGKAPEEWDLERRDYRVTTEEASKVGLVNAGSDYFENVDPLGEVSYIYPLYISNYSGAR